MNPDTISLAVIEARLKALMGTALCDSYCSLKIDFTCTSHDPAMIAEYKAYTDRLGFGKEADSLDAAFALLDEETSLKVALAKAEAELALAKEKADSLRAALAGRSKP